MDDIRDAKNVKIKLFKGFTHLFFFFTKFAFSQGNCWGK